MKIRLLYNETTSSTGNMLVPSENDVGFPIHKICDLIKWYMSFETIIHNVQHDAVNLYTKIHENTLCHSNMEDVYLFTCTINFIYLSITCIFALDNLSFIIRISCLHSYFSTLTMYSSQVQIRTRPQYSRMNRTASFCNESYSSLFKACFLLAKVCFATLIIWMSYALLCSSTILSCINENGILASLFWLAEPLVTCKGVRHVIFVKSDDFEHHSILSGLYVFRFFLWREISTEFVATSKQSVGVGDWKTKPILKPKMARYVNGQKRERQVTWSL